VPFEELSFFDIDLVVVDMATHDLFGSDDTLTLRAGDMPATGVTLLGVHAGIGTNTLRAVSGITNLNTSIGSTLGRNLDVQVTGSATRVNLLQTQDLQSLAIEDGLVSLETNGGQTVVRTTVLNMSGGLAPSGTLDLQDNGLIIDYSGASPYSALRGQIIHARNQDAPQLWTGTGITSSVAASDSVHAAVGYAEAVELFGGAHGVFMGQSLNGGDRAVLIRATCIGDANLDGVTDGSDFNLWNSNKFGSGDWLQADFTYDGLVDGSDFNAWNTNKFQSFFEQLVRGASEEER
jgi:hypothetical protein